MQPAQNSDSQSQQQQNCVYNLLPQARPLHPKAIVQLKSSFVFVGEPAPIIINNNNNNINDGGVDMDMEEIPEGRNSGIHDIGKCFNTLFSQPVYQSYQNLVLSDDNSKFGSCNVRYDCEQVIKPAQNISVNDQTLIFQSRFESGNLALASKSKQSPNEYFLALQRDTNSLATCQWYYFSIQNRDNIGCYTFNIVNLVKSYSAYQNGMRPCVMSMMAVGQGWKRDGFDIGYRRNSVQYKGERNYYTFRFSYNFMFRNDKVYFAYSYPYTFTKLQNFLSQLQFANPSIVQVKTLTKTLKNNPLTIVTITNPQSQSEIQHKKKDMIMFCARVHPGQTNGSFACQGLIRFLVQNNDVANNLRKFYVIKIIPFMNPDGVIHGNYRTSVSGNDLNRKWKKPDQQLHPQIYALKKYLAQTKHTKSLFIDLHGHSKKRSSFMYGCFNRQNPYLCKQIPFILSKKGHNFCYFNCNFSTPLSKDGTSRICLWKQFAVDYSYTFQMSFCGPMQSKRHFGTADYIKMGTQLARVLSAYFSGKKFSTSITPPQQITSLLKQLYKQKQLLDQGIQQSSGSESGQQQLASTPNNNLIVDKKDQKPISAISKQPSKQLTGILTKYFNDSKIKWRGRQHSKNRLIGIKSQERSSQINNNNIKNRKQLAPSRISIQKIDLAQQVSNPYISFGFAKGSIRATSRELKANNNSSSNQHCKISSNSHNGYGPYSSSKLRLISHRASHDQTLMLPKVVREQQLKYKKYRNNQYKFQISLSHQYQEKQNVGLGARSSSRSSTYGYGNNGSGSGKEISLAQKIFQSTQRQMQDSGRYWVRNS